MLRTLPHVSMQNIQNRAKGVYITYKIKAMKKILLSFVVVAFAVGSCNTETPEQKAKKWVEKELFKAKKETEHKKAEADSLLRIVVNEHQIMYVRIKALNELKEKHEYFKKYTDDELLHLVDRK